MAAQLNRSEPGTGGARRIARRQIAEALEALEKQRPTEQDIHSARKELKKARATLRLLREALGDAVYHRENVALRDAARSLSRIRDSKVLVDTLDKLIKRSGARARALPLDRLRRALSRERIAIRRSALKGAISLGPQRTLLRTVHERAAHWRVGRGGWSVLGPGVKRVYREARKRLAIAAGDRSSENLHEWRKQTKYLWHELQLLEPLRPAVIGKLADQAHKLSDLLGDDHDLAVLRARVMRMKEPRLNPAVRRALITAIDRHRGALQGKAIALGRQLFEERPDVFAARLGHYWRNRRRNR